MAEATRGEGSSYLGREQRLPGERAETTRGKDLCIFLLYVVMAIKRGGGESETKVKHAYHSLQWCE